MQKKELWGFENRESILIITEDKKLVNEQESCKVFSGNKVICTNKENLHIQLSNLRDFTIVLFDLRVEDSIIEFSSLYYKFMHVDARIILIGKEMNDNYLNVKY